MLQETIIGQMNEWAEKSPEKIWLKDLEEDGQKEWSWGKAKREISAIAHWLSDVLGGTGEAVSILSRNRAHWVMADTAIIGAKNVTVPMFTTQSADVAKYIFDFTDTKVLFVGESENWGAISEVVSENIIIVTFPGVEVDRESLRWDDLVEQYERGGYELSPGDAKDLITIVFTSGTTGMPKGVMQNHTSLLLPAYKGREIFTADSNSRLLSYLPLSHIAERNMIWAQSLVFCCEISFAQNSTTLVRDLQRTRPTFFFGVPRVWESLQQVIFGSYGGRESFDREFDADPESVRRNVRELLGFQEVDGLFSGAAPISTGLLNFYEALDLILIEGLGQTEAMGLFANRFDDRKKGSIGKPMTGVETTISESGELLVRGDGFATGYYKNKEKTEQTFIDGWLHTGDRARVDEEGFYFITGRINDYFKTIHGKFVAPSPIENDFSKSPLVDQVCLIGRGCSKTVVVCTLSSEGVALPAADVEALLTAHVDRLNDSIDEKHAKVGAVIVTNNEWTIENGFLTTTLKMKRPKVDEVFLDRASELASIAARDKKLLIHFDLVAK